MEIVITTGDPKGIGEEVTFKALQKFDGANFVIVHEKRPPFSKGIWIDVTSPKEFKIIDLKTNSLISKQSFKGKFYKDSTKNLPGQLAARKIEVAVTYIKKNKQAKALVTAPIHKARMIEEAKAKFGAHTEYLQKLFNSKKVIMCMKNDHFSVSLLTVHEPLSKVPSLIAKKDISKEITFISSELTRFRISKDPMILLGLNPHAGEDGHIGRQERDFFRPALKKIQKKIEIQGPISADTAFINIPKGAHYIACYHDQGLIPIKTLRPYDTINITLGLPILRTSPDHGTADNIVGLNQADSKSMECAIEEALKLVHAV